MTHSTITVKGQTTIPVLIRNHLKLNSGDKVEFIIDTNGKVFLVPYTTDIRSLKGILPAPKHPISLSDMQKAIEEGASRGWN